MSGGPASGLPASGVPAGGASVHGQGCQCVRCRGFRAGETVGLETRFGPGNDQSLVHGAYVGLRDDLARAVERLGPEVVEEAATIRRLVPGYAESDELAVLDLAVTRIRIARAARALHRVDEAAGEEPLRAYAAERQEQLESLRRDLHRWLRHSRMLLNDLGLTTASRFGLGLVAARTQLDLRALSDAELRELERIVARAEGVG